MVNLYKKGCVETITVGELVEYLQTFPDKMRVAYTWEGQILPVVLDKNEVVQETAEFYGPLLLLEAETL